MVRTPFAQSSPELDGGMTLQVVLLVELLFAYRKRGLDGPTFQILVTPLSTSRVLALT